MSDTPETDRIAIAACDDTGGLCRPEILWDALERLERQRNDARELARELRELASGLRIHLMNLVDHEPCKCCYDDQAETDWAEAKSLLDKAKELLCN